MWEDIFILDLILLACKIVIFLCCCVCTLSRPCIDMTVPVTVSVSSRRNYQMFDYQFDKYNTTIWKTYHSWQVSKLYSTELWDWKSDISVQISIINQFCYACKSKQITLVVFKIGYGRIGELSMSVMFAADESFFFYLQFLA